MSEVPGSGETVTAPPPVPDFPTYERESNARDLGQPIAPATPAAPPPATPGDTGAATAATPDAASEPAAPPDKTPRNLQTRLTELDSETAQLQQKLALRKALREELSTLDRPVHGKPASDPAQPQPKATWERYKHLQGAPQADEFETYEDYLDARAEFIVDKHSEERDRRASLERQSHERMSETQQLIKGFGEKLEKARSEDPAFDDKVNPALFKIVPAFALRPDEPLRPANVILQACVDSEVAPALFVHFSTPEGQREWAELVAAPTAAETLRRFGRIEGRFVSDGTPAGVPPAKPVTSAPAPPTTLGHKPPSSPDRVGAALKAGDYLTYEAAQDAADLAVRRR